MIWRKTDKATHAHMTIDYPHHEIHDGNAFYVMYIVASLGAMAAPDDMVTLTFKTPNTTKWSHFQFLGKGTAGWRLRFIEAPSGGFTSPTGQLVPLNHNRNSSNTSGIFEPTGVTVNEVDYDSILATGGVTLWDDYLEGAGGPFAAGTGSGGRDELMLKQNTVYQLSLYGVDTDPATLYMNWYEHTNKTIVT